MPLPSETGREAESRVTSNAQTLQAAFSSGQLARLVSIMDPWIVWRGVPGPGDPDANELEHIPICRSREEVRGTMQDFIDQGGDAEPIILAEQGDSVLVELRARTGLTDHDLGAPPQFQVFTFRGATIALIQDYPDRETALAALLPPGQTSDAIHVSPDT
jgi:hypothetical protein